MREFEGDGGCSACRLETAVRRLVSFAANSWVLPGLTGFLGRLASTKRMFHEFSCFAVVAKLADAHA